jgi:hypothetical protein
MSNEIVLNLNLPEYQDDFLGDGEENSGLWQQQANAKLVELLKDMGMEAKQYKTVHDKTNGVRIKKLNSYHHAVFISGGRGTGKTVFLRNAEAVWSAYSKNIENPPNLHFIDVLDPTLLSITDRFSEVIIASVYAATDKALAKPNIDQHKKNRFFNAMTTLAGALGKSSEFDELRGIDRIQKYRSGIQLEQYFHQFLIASVDLLDCDAIVLPIDDVDMKIDNAFGVLDDIRCLLSCPLVLPLVSGDDEIYRHISTMKFEDALAKNKESPEHSARLSEASQLSNAYLTKVFPQHTRLPLLQIDRLLPYLRIQYGEQRNDSILYSEYIERIGQKFYPFCNQPEARENGLQSRTAWLQPKSARQLVQQIKVLPPAHVISEDNHIDSWQRLKSLAESNKNGITVANTESYLYVRSATSENQLSLLKLISFNPIMQKNHYQWGDNDFVETQRSFRREILNKINPEINIDDSINTDPSENSVKPQRHILCDMPPIELPKNQFFISQAIAEEAVPVDERIALMVYTHHDVYNNQQNRRYHVLFSRAFEILFWSLLYITKNVDQRFDFKKVLTNICLRPPFYSRFSFTIDDFIDGYTPSSDNWNDNDDVIFKNEIELLHQQIQRWKNENEQSLARLADKNLIPLLNDIFHDVFYQTRRIGAANKTIKDAISRAIGGSVRQTDQEYLSDLVQRFKYIFMNSIAIHVKKGMVVDTAIAINTKIETIRDIKSFFNTNKTISRNYQDILDLSKLPNIELREEANNEIGYLLYAMWKHPVFQFLNTTTYPVGPIDRSLLSTNKNNNTNTGPLPEFHLMSPKEMSNYYLLVNGYSTINIKEVKEWAENSSDEALEIFARLEELSRRDPEIKSAINGLGNTARLYKGINQALKINPKD